MKLQRLLLLTIIFMGMALSVSAEIILQNQSDGFVAVRPNRFSPMTGIVIISPVPSASASPQVARNLHRAHGWSVDEQQNFETNGSLIVGGVGAAKDRKSSVRANIARAQAFRLDYFK